MNVIRRCPTSIEDTELLELMEKTYASRSYSDFGPFCSDMRRMEPNLNAWGTKEEVNKLFYNFFHSKKNEGLIDLFKWPKESQETQETVLNPTPSQSKTVLPQKKKRRLLEDYWHMKRKNSNPKGND